MLRKSTATIVLCGSLIFAVGATAAPTVVDQYTEQVPSAGGDKPANSAPSSDAAGGSSSGGEQPSGVGSDAGSIGGNDSGSSGSATPGGSDTPGAGSQGGSGGSNEAKTLSGSSQSSISATVADGIETSADSGGMGLAFPLFLGIALALTVAVVVLRTRDDSLSSRAS